MPRIPLSELIKKKYGRLTILKEATPVVSNSNRKIRKFYCLCDCGVEKIIDLGALRFGSIISCGCYNKELKTKHSLSRTKEYSSWYDMIRRCTNKNGKYYHRYGGRGIMVCDRWMNLENFYKDMGKKPTSNHTLERINNNGNYEPKNCKWASMSDQSRNRSSNIKYKGECAKDASIRLGGNVRLVHKRLKDGWTKKNAFTSPVKQIKL